MISFLIVGLVAGWLASVIMKTDASQGWLMDIILGVIGAFIGGFVMNMLGQSGVDGLNIYSILVATLGAAIAIWIGRKLKT
jgi:uncharacterized membrane protein YeaQ/YmgE (transglycosylase-associated protein family)